MLKIDGVNLDKAFAYGVILATDEVSAKISALARNAVAEVNHARVAVARAEAELAKAWGKLSGSEDKLKKLEEACTRGDWGQIPNVLAESDKGVKEVSQ